MGCGVSSASQISPISGEVPYDFKNGATQSFLNCSTPTNSANRSRTAALLATAPSPPVPPPTRFNLAFLCRSFYGNNSAALVNGNLQQKQYCSTQMQTESDLLGFKCQHTQTDSLILSDGELEAMMEELEKEMKSALEENKDTKSLCTVNGADEIEDEIDIAHKSWKGIIRAHKDEIETTKRYANIAVQATRPTATSATQTKFGSIDHQFVPNPNSSFFSKSPKDFLEQSELLTKTLSENLLKVIEQPSALSTLLTSLDEDEEIPSSLLIDGEPDKIVDSIQRTLADYDTESRRQSIDLQGREGTPPKVHPNEISDQNCTSTTSPTNAETVITSTDEAAVKPAKNRPSLLDTRKRLKDAQKRLKLLKQQKFHDTLEMLLEDIRNKKPVDLVPAPGK